MWDDALAGVRLPVDADDLAAAFEAQFDEDESEAALDRLRSVRGTSLQSLGRGPVRGPVTAGAEELERAYRKVDMASMPEIPADAPCQSGDPEAWFSPLPDPTHPWWRKNGLRSAAQQLCHGCPVLAECLSWALANPAQEGVLGGTTHRERKRFLSDRGGVAA